MDNARHSSVTVAAVVAESRPEGQGVYLSPKLAIDMATSLVWVTSPGPDREARAKELLESGKLIILNEHHRTTTPLDIDNVTIWMLTLEDLNVTILSADAGMLATDLQVESVGELGLIVAFGGREFCQAVVHFASFASEGDKSWALHLTRLLTTLPVGHVIWTAGKDEDGLPEFTATPFDPVFRVGQAVMTKN